MSDFNVVLISEEQTPSRFIRMYRETTLPFAPYAGLSIRWSHDGKDWHDGCEFEVSNVAWNQDSREFVCLYYFFAEYGDVLDDEDDVRTLAELHQEIIKDYMELGWTIDESRCKEGSNATT